MYDPQGNPKNWCHAGTTQRQSLFLSLIPLCIIRSQDSDPGTESGQFGNYSCDGTRLTLLSAIETMRVVESQPDFILWTGDSAPHWHEPSDPNWDYIFKAEKDIVSRLREAFPHTLILPALGNHDSFPADFFPGSSKDTFNCQFCL